MIKGKRLLAIIPARGGSKRLPRKNVMKLAGKPLIAWTINAAKKSKFIDRLIVSTDDQEISLISKQYGADVPFMRPASLSSDTATSIDVVLHALDELDEGGDQYDYVMLLQPTSPLRTTEDIDGAVKQLIEKNSQAVISVCKAEHHPLWCNTLGDDLSMEGFLSDEILNQRSQDLPDYYRLNGAVYLVDVKTLREMGHPTFFFKENATAYVMPLDRSIDIDNKNDFVSAEVLADLTIRDKAVL